MLSLGKAVWKVVVVAVDEVVGAIVDESLRLLSSFPLRGRDLITIEDQWAVSKL